jgi:hypothetical protein
MDTKEILRKAALLKRNPDLANVIPNSEIIALVTDVLGAFTNLQKAIETNKIKGEDGKTPVAGKDYPSFEQVDKTLADSLKEYSREYAKFQSDVQQAIDRASKLKDGKNAEITPEIIDEIAQIASSLVDLPDFDNLVTTEINRNGEAVRNALELLIGDERYKVELADVQGLEKILQELAQIRSVTGGTIGKQQVYGFIQQAISDGILIAKEMAWANGSSTTNNKMTVSATEPANPSLNDIWIRI